jgi:putative ABC transport system ATP-binding protein
LLQVMGTLDRASSGTVRLAGFEASAMRDQELAGLRATRIGFVFQQFFLAEHATVLDNVADGLLYAGVAHRKRRDFAAHALRQVGLGNRIHARPTQLSGGQRQRVAIARALIGRPNIVLADEPTGNLDHTTGQAILSLLTALHHTGTTIVIVTHDLDIARSMPRQIHVLDGQIISDTKRALP